MWPRMFGQECFYQDFLHDAILGLRILFCTFGKTFGKRMRRPPSCRRLRVLALSHRCRKKVSDNYDASCQKCWKVASCSGSFLPTRMPKGRLLSGGILPTMSIGGLLFRRPPAKDVHRTPAVQEASFQRCPCAHRLRHKIPQQYFLAQAFSKHVFQT